MQKNNTLSTILSSYLEGGGECCDLIRRYDWSKTSIGSVETWPISLLTTVSTLLNSRFPMFLWWGKDLLQFYNDAYRQSLGQNGKHPYAIGQKGIECWPEAWGTIEPMIKQVLAGGGATWNDDQLVPIYRNNKIEDVYWTYSYSQVLDDKGVITGVLVICYESTAKVQTLKAVEESREELEFVIEAAEIGIWDWNLSTGILTGNKRIEDWFGIRIDDPSFIKKSIDLAVIATDRERVTAAVDKALQKGSGRNYNITYSVISLSDQLKRVLKARGKTVHGADGAPIRFSGTIQDVTEEYTVQQRKDEFLSVASHELKTPLTTLKASIQLLEKIMLTDGNLSKVPLLIKKANNNVEKLTDIIDDLMNTTKIQQGQIQLNKSWFTMSHLVENSCDHLRFTNKYSVSITGNLEITVYADMHRIDQVIINFINNAIKYAPESLLIGVDIEA